MYINDAVKFFGTKAELARVLGIKPSSIYDWKNGLLPKLRAMELRELTSGKIKYNPNLYK